MPSLARKLSLGKPKRTSSANDGDPYWNNVVLLMHGDGVPDSKNFIDETGNVVTAHGNAKHSSQESKFSNSSIFLDGTGSYLTIPYVKSKFDWWLSDFTIECFVYLNSLVGTSYDGAGAFSTLVGNIAPQAYTSYWGFGPASNGSVRFNFHNGSNLFASSAGGVIQPNTMTHIAMTHSNSTIKIWVNGIVRATAGVTGTPLTYEAFPLTIGQMFGVNMNGYVDDLRITKGVARYKENFTPPTDPFPNHGITPSGNIGIAGTQGFGVGICPNQSWLTELGLSEMEGTRDKNHENYGNYQHTNGSISVFIPKFYYAIGHVGTPTYAKYGANAFHVVGDETFSGEAAANIAGYALHRAFIDGGKEKPGFFYDKYLASKDGNASCKSVKNGHPISLGTTVGFMPSSAMTGCTGILADAVVLSRARGYGWNTISLFMADALSKIAMAHGQAATSTNFCAWYDASGAMNFPKGCNTGNPLRDVNDSSVTFTAAIDTTPLTGSASNLAKTTHNGQANGITDVNGAMYQITIGVTYGGNTATSSTQVTTGMAYVLKRSSKHANLTGGWNSATDAWGSEANLLTRYDSIAGFFPWGASTEIVKFGNGSAQVFDSAVSGTGYLRTCSGVQMANTSMSASGSTLFGNDFCSPYDRHNMIPEVSGAGTTGSAAGIFTRNWTLHRAHVFTNRGFRAGAYGS